MNQTPPVSILWQSNVPSVERSKYRSQVLILPVANPKLNYSLLHLIPPWPVHSSAWAGASHGVLIVHRFLFYNVQF